MKKIIYSFVIMIAAGSLFTSCVTNTEPQGIKDIREAKANYLDALANLRTADAAVRNADAEYRKAETALKQAEAAVAEAVAKAAEIAVSVEQAWADKEIADLVAQAEQDAVDAKKALAEKQYLLEQALRDIAAKSIGLSENEQKAIQAKVDNLQKAQKNYHDAFVKVERKKIDIWNKEYDHDSINGMTKEDWEAEIAKAESKIAIQEAKIAGLEEMKEVPESIKDYLDAYQDSILDLRKDSLAALQAKGLYEVTTLKEANKAYKEARDKFVNDSVGSKPKFSFKQESTLLDATYGLDAQFQVFVGTYATNGFVSFDGDKFTVKADKKDDYKAIEKDVKALKAIVEALNRDQVIIDNIADSLAVEDAKAKYGKADSLYKAHYAILKAGLDKYGDYKLANDTLKMFKDTLKAAQKDSIAAAKKLVGDTAVVLKNYKGLVDEYKNAVSAFVYIADSYGAGSVSKSRLITAVNGLGDAQEAYIGRQDSVEITRKVVVGTSTITGTTNVAFSDLTVKDFDLNTGLFDDILAAANCCAFDITPANVGKAIAGEQVANGLYDEDKPLAYKVNVNATKKDTIDWFHANAKYGAYGPFVADGLALEAAQDAYDAAADKVAARTDSVNTVVNKFNEIGKAFWANPAFDATDEDNNYQIVWSDKTFSEPSNCVFFYADGDSLVPTKALLVALDGIYGKTDYVDTVKDVNECPIFFGPNVSNRAANFQTEFSKALYAKQVYEALADNESRVAQLANINEQVETLDKAFTAAKESFDKANATYVAGYTRLTGKKDGLEVTTLSEQNVDKAKGKWNLAGKQLELANQFAPEYPELVKNADSGVQEIEEKIADTKEYIEFLEKAYVAYKNLDEAESYVTVQDVIDALEDEIDVCDSTIETLEKAIQQYKKNIAKLEAGYDRYTVELESEYAELDRLESELEFAEEQLKIAQAEYDEVIEKYGIKDAE